MESLTEEKQLTAYAEVTGSKILESQSDLNPKDKAHPAMLAWCREHGDVVVLQSNDILCNAPLSRRVSNCKTIMRNKALAPGNVFAARHSLIRILLENAEIAADFVPVSNNHISIQQQRLRMLVKEAIELNATDIHLEVREKIAKIRLRRHGELLLHAEWLPKLAREICSVAFNSETDHAISHFNPLVPQNASMPITIEGEPIRLRLASLPAHQGYDVVMRLLTASRESVNTLDQLGYDDDQIRLIHKAMQMPAGAILVAGPTGAGKTTSLASAMQLIGSERKVYSVEDPVEKIVDSITQVPVNTEHYDRTFASMTRTTLRMDPDVIVIGEIRDEDTANVMCRAAITGHLVLSTIHTNSAIDIITRLNDLGISRSLLASYGLVVCLLCQRLVPLLCQHCAIPLTSSTQHQNGVPRWKKVFTQMDTLKARGRQCRHCHDQGIAGRTVVAEIIWLDNKGRECIQRGDFLAWKQHLRNNGWQTYQDRLIKMVADGLCDPLDAEKLIGEIEG